MYARTKWYTTEISSVSFSYNMISKVLIDCSQLSTVLLFFSSIERTDRITRELEASAKRGDTNLGWEPR